MRKKDIKLVAMLLFVIMAVLLPATCFASGTDWTQFQNDLCNSGMTTNPCPLTTPVVGWKQQVGNTTMAGIDVETLVAGGNVYALDAMGMAWAFDAQTGAQVWATQLSCTGTKFQLATPAYDSGKLYMATNDGHVYALDATSGSVLWDQAMTLASPKSQLNTPVKCAGGKIYVGAWNHDAKSDEYYYCLDAATGNPGIGSQYQMPNTASPGGYYWAGACFVDKYMIFGSDSSVVTCLDQDTGALLDSVDLKQIVPGAKEIRSSVSCDSANNLIFLTDQATQSGCCWAFGLDPATGKLTPKWHTQLGFSTSTPAVYNGRVYVGTGIYSLRGGVYCLDESTGSVIWKYIATGQGAASVPGVQASPVISVRNGAPYIYFPTIWEHSSVICLNQNGNQVWEFQDKDCTYILQGVAAAGGWLYFGNDGGWLYALQPAGEVAVPVLAPAAATTVSAPAAGSGARFIVGQRSYYAGDQQVAMDAAPFISGGRTLVPVRYLAEALGAQTAWDGPSQALTITRGSVVVKLVINSFSILVNNNSEQMDTAPVISGGRTYLPARVVAEALGYTVSWDASSQAVTVSANQP